MYKWVVEGVGILAALLILLSFTKSNTKQIRIINTVGSFIFVVYGILIGSVSTAFLNAVCIGLQIYKLRKGK